MEQVEPERPIGVVLIDRQRAIFVKIVGHTREILYRCSIERPRRYHGLSDSRIVDILIRHMCRLVSVIFYPDNIPKISKLVLISTPGLSEAFRLSREINNQFRDIPIEVREVDNISLVELGKL